jgi:L-iditol 2-dehydrogenase
MINKINQQKSAFWSAPGKLEVKDNAIPDVVKGSILVKIESCAVCGSDLRIFNDGNPRIKPPRIIGHEISGEVIAIGEGVSNYKIGDMISTGADIPCGQCEHCLNGRSNCCDINYAIGYQFDGGFSQYMLLDPLVVKHGPIQKVKNGVDPDIAALSEPLACCINGYERGLIKPGSTIVVFGGGPIGLMLCLLAPIYKANKLIIIEPSENRLEFAKNNIRSINHFINPLKNDPVKEIMQITNGLGADLIFTANPVAKTHEQAVDVVGKRGVVNLFGGLPKTAKKIEILSNNIHYKEAYLTGSHGSTPQQHKKALELIEEKKIRLDFLITHKFPLKDIHKAFETAKSGKGLKVIVNPNA